MRGYGSAAYPLGSRRSTGGRLGAVAGAVALQQLVLALIVVLAYLSVIFGSQGASRHPSAALVALLVINGAIATIAIVKDNRLFSIGKMHWWFQLVFLSMAPLAQRLNGYYCSGYLISDDYFLYAAAVVFVWNVCFFTAYELAGRKASRAASGGDRAEPPVVLDRTAQIVLVVLAVFGFVVLVALVGFDNLFIKAENNVEFESSTISFLVKKFLTAFPAMALAGILLSRGGVRPVPLAATVLLVLTVLSNFPTSTTRYWMAAILAGVALIWLHKDGRVRWVDFAIILGLVIVFPMMYIFKFQTLDTVQLDFSGVLNLADTFCSVDYDAFTLLARVIQYTDTDGFTLGRQILGVALFFIPRAWWPGKPLATGPMVADSQGSRYTNLSCPLPAEGYVDFGVFGVVLLAIAVAVLAKALDSRYWLSARSRDVLDAINICYPFLTLLIIYVSRGPLKPSFMQVISMMLPALLVFWFARSRSGPPAGEGQARRKGKRRSIVSN